ncbi:hypothetical protein, partial [Tistrella bauzanensis]|uniref:hypothetical protein n=1 Tax=Tistrella bauzanensis TaxID=657419 RepID=UPI001E582B4F
MGSQMHEGKRPEIFIGLIGAVGIDLKNVGDGIAERLRRAKYHVDRIKVSDCLMDLRGEDKEKIQALPIDKRINLLQDYGDLLCRQAEHADAAMWPALAEISRLRETATYGGNGRAYEPVAEWAPTLSMSACPRAAGLIPSGEV